jgi:hypothetical protein
LYRPDEILKKIRKYKLEKNFTKNYGQHRLLSKQNYKSAQKGQTSIQSQKITVSSCLLKYLCHANKMGIPVYVVGTQKVKMKFK